MAQGYAGAGNAVVAAAPLPNFTRLFFPQDSSNTLVRTHVFVVPFSSSIFDNLFIKACLQCAANT